MWWICPNIWMRKKHYCCLVVIENRKEKRNSFIVEKASCLMSIHVILDVLIHGWCQTWKWFIFFLLWRNILDSLAIVPYRLIIWPVTVYDKILTVQWWLTKRRDGDRKIWTWLQSNRPFWIHNNLGSRNTFWYKNKKWIVEVDNKILSLAWEVIFKIFMFWKLEMFLVYFLYF